MSLAPAEPMPEGAEYYVTASHGTETALAEELRELGLSGVQADGAGVRFAGTKEDAHRACLASRIGVRVLRPLAEFPCRTGEELYARAREIDWTEHLSPRHTLAISSTCRDSTLTHSLFVTQRTKDAVVDQLREKAGARPSVDREDPDVSITVRLVRDRATVSLDLGGKPLHLRGYREPGGAAPIKETIAAAILRLSGWDRVTPLVDPMCGTGTFAIEADLWARRVAPGLVHARFGFERWPGFGAEAARRLADLRAQLRAAELPEGPPIFASDIDARAVELARASVARARAHVQVARARVGDLEGTSPPGTVVANLPYGERLDIDPGLAREIRRGLQALSPGHRVALLVLGRPKIGAPAGARFLPVANGPLRCTLVTWTVR